MSKPIRIKKTAGGKLLVKPFQEPVGLTKDERNELVDLLRKNFLYQQPIAAHPQGVEPDPQNPAFLVVRMLPGHWERMMELIRKAGGWTMPDDSVITEVQQ